jgi:nicotinamidase-related amidase
MRPHPQERTPEWARAQITASRLSRDSEKPIGKLSLDHHLENDPVWLKVRSVFLQSLFQRPEIIRAASDHDRFENVIRQYDVDGSGKLSLYELDGMLTDLTNEQFPAEDLELIMKTLDSNNDKSIGYNEFRACWHLWTRATMKSKSCVVVCGMQNDMISGKIALDIQQAGVDGKKILREVKNLVSHISFDLIVYTRKWYSKEHAVFIESQRGDKYGGKKVPRHCERFTWGAELHPDLDIGQNDYIVYIGSDPDVRSYSAFYDDAPDISAMTGLLPLLRSKEINEVYVCGASLDSLVGTTALHSAENGFLTAVVEDACGIIDESSAVWMRANLENAGIQIISQSEAMGKVKDFSSSGGVAQEAALQAALRCSEVRLKHLQIRNELGSTFCHGAVIRENKGRENEELITRRNELLAQAKLVDGPSPRRYRHARNLYQVVRVPEKEKVVVSEVIPDDQTSMERAILLEKMSPLFPDIDISEFEEIVEDVGKVTNDLLRAREAKDRKLHFQVAKNFWQYEGRSWLLVRAVYLHTFFDIHMNYVPALYKLKSPIAGSDLDDIMSQHISPLEDEDKGSNILDINKLNTILFDLMGTKFREGDLDILASSLDINGDDTISTHEFKAAWNIWMSPIHPIRRVALLVTDMQNDFISGSLKMDGAATIVPNINLLREFYKFEMVALSRDWHPANHCSFHDNAISGVTKLAVSSNVRVEDLLIMSTVTLAGPPEMQQMLYPRHCVQGSDGAKFHTDLRVDADDVIINKGENKNFDGYSAFFDQGRAPTKLFEALKLKNITDLVICGIALDVCVGSSALHAAEHGIRTYVVEDCTCNASDRAADSMIESLKAAQIQIIPSTEYAVKYFESISPSKRNQSEALSTEKLDDIHIHSGALFARAKEEQLRATWYKTKARDEHRRIGEKVVSHCSFDALTRAQRYAMRDKWTRKRRAPISNERWNNAHEKAKAQLIRIHELELDALAIDHQGDREKSIQILFEKHEGELMQLQEQILHFQRREMEAGGTSAIGGEGEAL